MVRGKQMDGRSGVMDSELWTITQIAESLGIARHRVEYAIQREGLEAVAMVGNTRVFSPEQFERIVGSMVRLVPMSRVGTQIGGAS